MKDIFGDRVGDGLKYREIWTSRLRLECSQDINSLYAIDLNGFATLPVRTDTPASRSIRSIDFNMYTDIGQVLVRFAKTHAAL